MPNRCNKHRAKREEYKKHSQFFGKLRSKMIFYIFFAMTITISVALCVVIMLVTNGTITRMNPLIPIMFIWLFSIMTGTVMSYFIYNYIFHDFDEFITAMKTVSKGNFDVKMRESEHYMDEIYESFNLMVQSLKSIETLKTDFISSFSHEFKTPIASICGFAKLLKNPNISDEDREEYINIIITESTRLTQLSQNTLALTKLETQESIFEKKPYSLDEQLRTCSLLFQTEIEARDIEFVMSETEETFVGSETLMSQLWINLISNAVKFTPNGGRIEVLLARRGDNIAVTVSDTGCGMAEEDCVRIFDKFYQIDKARSHGGNGLGLSIAKKIVELAGGEITVTSAPDMGSTFTVTLPSPALPEKPAESSVVIID